MDYAPGGGQIQPQSFLSLLSFAPTLKDPLNGYPLTVRMKYVPLMCAFCCQLHPNCAFGALSNIHCIASELIILTCSLLLPWISVLNSLPHNNKKNIAEEVKMFSK